MGRKTYTWSLKLRRNIKQKPSTAPKQSADKSEKPRIGPASPTQKIFFDDDTTDVIIFGGGAGSGKTALSQMKVLKYVDDPNFNAIFSHEHNKYIPPLF